MRRQEWLWRVVVMFLYPLQDGSVVHFKIKRNTQLKKLMQAYCDRQGFQMNTIRFMFDGNHLGPETTPAEVSSTSSSTEHSLIFLFCQLEMEDDDTIEVFQQQTGGHWLGGLIYISGIINTISLYNFSFLSFSHLYPAPPLSVLVTYAPPKATFTSPSYSLQPWLVVYIVDKKKNLIMNWGCFLVLPGWIS